MKAKPTKARPARGKLDALSCIPTSWLDSLLTGPEAVIGKPPYTCRDIERLLQAVRERVIAINAQPQRKGKT